MIYGEITDLLTGYSGGAECVDLGECRPMKGLALHCIAFSLIDKIVEQ